MIKDRHGIMSAEKSHFEIKYGMRCYKCGKENVVCIQEPASAKPPWLCRECYSGMTREQYDKNMKALGRINGKRGVYGVYDQKTKTVNLTREKVVEEKPATDLFGGDE